MGNFFNSSNRDYSLNGEEAKKVNEKGFFQAEWYSTPIPRSKLKDLMIRKNWPGIRDTVIWLFILVFAGFLVSITWGSWYVVPALFIYGLFWALPADSRQHECRHGTAFRSPWLNEVIYYLSCLMNLRMPTAWRWSHTRHHSDTIIVGLDPEVIAPRPPVWRIIFVEFGRLFSYPAEIKKMVLHSFGLLNNEEKIYIPSTDWKRCAIEARFFMMSFIILLSICIYLESWKLFVLLFLPQVYGAIFPMLLAMVQHLGLNEDVLDHRLNTRTIHLNPLLRFLYWNMNYHMEHHMYPMVPYHALPKLHEAIKHDCPKPNAGLFSALKEIIPILIKQKAEPSFNIVRELPNSANPYKYGPHPFGTVTAD